MCCLPPRVLPCSPSFSCPVRADLALASVVLLYLAVVVGTAVVGGLPSSLAAAVASDLAVNFFFVPPHHTLTVDSRDNLITLVVYIAVAVTVSLAMDVAARQRAAAARTGIEAELMARISAEPVREGSVRSLLEHIRAALHMETAAIIETAGDGTERVVAIDGRHLTGTPTLSVPATDHLTLVVEGPPLFAADPKFLARLAAAAARTLQAERLAAQAAQARELAEIDRLRSALLTAVGHDLRTPLAAIKAGASSLRAPDLELTDTQQAELLATIEHLLEALVRNPERLVTHQQLLHEIWGPRYETETNYLRVHMANLRRKLEPDPSRPRYLRTDPGLGFRFTPDSPS